MNNTDKQFKELANEILKNGHDVNDRTGIGTKSIFGYQMRFKMSEGFPLLTLRKIHTKSVIHELLWFLGSFDEKWDRFGNCNIRPLLDQGVSFWSEWPFQEYEKRRTYRPELPKLTLQEFEQKIKDDDQFALDFGSIGKGYGKQWLNCGGEVKKLTDEQGNTSFEVIQGVNQIEDCINQLRNNQDSRRIIVDSWNPIDLSDMLLPPCHMFFQFKSYKMNPSERVEEFKKEYPNTTKTIKELNFPERKLSIQMYIRSNDIYLGESYNVAEYALLLHMVSQVVNMIPDELVYTIGDAHLYKNSIEATKTIIQRNSFPLPTLKLNKNIESIYDFRYEDIVIENYKSHPNIKVDVAV
jgi:thymidylate synthase